MNTLVLLQLVFAHFLADFTLQTNAIVQGKESGGWKGAKYLFLHSIIHAAVAYLLVADWNNVWIPIVILTTHFLIDWLKVTFLPRKMKWFLVDQSLHLGVIFSIWYWGYAPEMGVVFPIDLNSSRIWLVATAYLFVLQPSSILLCIFIQQWTPKDLQEKSLPNAGKWIGYLERVLILTFMLVGHLEAVGFLLAAKSIFRFGELNKAREIRTTEYVMIGTLASFTLACLTGMVIMWIQ